MRAVLTALLIPALAVAPAFAEPRVSASMPAIKASLAGDQVVVRLDQGILGGVKSLEPRTLVVVAKDASGKTVAETSANVSRRMTYARIPVTPAIAGAATVTVSVR